MMSELVPNTGDGAVPRAFAVLELLALSNEPLRLSAIALRLGMQKSTVHRVLATLVLLGYVEQEEESSCYRASLRLWELGTGLVAQHPVKRAAAGFLQQLHQATHETVSLTVLSGDDVLYLDKIVSPRPIRFTSRVGSRVPAPLTAGGKAMLAYEPGARAIARRTRQRIQDKRRIEIESLMSELDQVREAGFATSSFRPGVESFGAPIMAQDGRAAAAISVSAPTSRLSASKREAIVEQLLATCADLAERVGAL
ncbi:MAG: IclR family transcriptional regulator [Pseudomonadales bacterium]|nr:IclR family transcriptional regulator [Pseudomonadales bacterium]